MSNIQMWSLIAGFFLPPILAVIQQSHWTNTLRAIVTFIACLVVALGTTYFNGGINAKDWVQSALVVLVATLSTYHGLWKTSGVAPMIETGTNIRANKKAVHNG